MGRKQGKWRRLRLLAGMAMTWIYVLTMAAQAYGAEAKVVSAVVSDGFIYIYLRGIAELGENTMFQIGSQACPREDVAVGTIDSLEVPMRTILLVDNSKSIPEKNHEDIKALLKGVVWGAMEGEMIRIGTISDQLTYECTFTSDKEMLESIIEGIAYWDQDTYLSDILYDVITQLEKEDTGVLTRIVVFADGADDKAIGYTNEEVRELIERGSYPVYAIGFPKKNNPKQLETMFSFARASSSEYYLVDETIAREEIIEGLLQDQNDLCIRIRPDESLFDGGSRHIRMKLDTPQGDIELTATVRMPFGEGKEPETEKAWTNSQEETEIETVTEALPTITPEERKPKPTVSEKANGETFLWMYPGLGVSAAVIGAGLAFWFLRSRSKRKRAEETNGADGRKEQGQDVKAMESGNWEDETRLNLDEDPDEARPLWEKKQYCVTLHNIDKPGISYTALIADVVRVGRMGNDINIPDDNTVSKRHCELILRGEILYIKDVGSKNGTKYHNVRIDGEISVASGDIVEIGRSRYRVELEKNGAGS